LHYKALLIQVVLVKAAGQIYAYYGSLRLDGTALKRILAAILFAGILHLGGYLGYKEALHRGWLRSLAEYGPVKAVNRFIGRVVRVVPVAAVPDTQREKPIPVVFIEVPPSLASEVPPTRAQYYSDKDVVAASPIRSKVGDQPRIDGTQKEIPSLAEISKPIGRQVGMTPADTLHVTPEVKNGVKQPEAIRENPTTDGVAIGRVRDTTIGATREAVSYSQDARGRPARPRTLQEALARSHSVVSGEKMKQDGSGTRRQSLEASVDVVASPFGEYDKLLIQAVRDRWYYLLDSGNFSYERKGRVVIQFRLHYDGRVSDMEVLENTVNDLLCLLCQKAILDPAPYGRWPVELRRMVPSDYRLIRFTFYYN